MNEDTARAPEARHRDIASEAEPAADLEKELHAARERLNEAFDCIAQVHGRAHHAQRNLLAAREAEAHLRNSFSYQVGALLVRHGRSPAGWVRLPIALWRLVVRHRRQPTAASSPASDAEAARAIAVTQAGGTWIPLTREPQTVRIRCAEGADVWMSAICAEAGRNVTITVQTLRPEPTESNGRTVDQLERLRNLALRRLTLSPGRSVRLVEGGSGDITLRVAREDERFCVLRIDARPAEGGQRQPLESPIRPVAIERAPSAATPAASTPDDSGELPWRFSADKLQTKLWGGFARYAVPALEKLESDASTSARERRNAAWYLAQWFYVEGDYGRALDDLELAKRSGGNDRADIALAEAQCLIKLQRFDAADALLKKQVRKHRRKRLEIDFRLLRSTVARHLALQRGASAAQADAAQLRLINELYVSAGLAPLQKIRPHDPLHLSNITATARPRHRDQHLKVSVIIPAYNAGEMIGWVIASLLNQTWRNLEVVVVDDCSTDNSREVVEEIARTDPRVKLVRMTENRGAYAARNTGARHASGDLITVHDSDDWSHPQRIELQVAALESSHNLVASKSHWVRVSEQLEVIGPWIPRGSLVDLNFSSLLFRRELLDVIGVWDEVRVSGDAEFFARLKRVFGAESVLKLPRHQLLALSLAHDSSLTRSKATHLRSLYHGLRRNYRHAYQYWHSQLTGDGDELPFDPGASRRRFPVPPSNRLLGKQANRKYDLVVISDLAMPGGAFVSTLNYIVAACKAGKRTAIFHWNRFDLSANAPLQPRLYEACMDFEIDILGPGDEVETELVLVGYPPILQYRIEPMPDISTKHLAIIVNQYASRLVTGEDQQYDPLRVRSHLRTIFGTEGVWIPISNWVKRLMEQDGRYPAPYPDPWYPMIDVDSWCARRIRWRGAERRRPVVGRHGRDSYTKWPSDPCALRAAYGVGQEWDVRFLGGAERAVGLLGERPRNWTIVPWDEMSAQEFLGDLDIFLHYPHEQYIEEFGRAVMEAMALGIPAILPPQFRETFGDAATYARPSEVPGVVADLWRSKDRYLERAEAGRSFVLKNCGLSAFPDRLGALLEAADRQRATIAEARELSATGGQ